ncbi:MAG: hypothetical protein ACQEQG_09305, partial [Bacillota bacterium]
SWNSNWEIIGATIELDVQYEGDILRALMYHEFAHSFRFGHSPDSTDIMYPSLSNQLEPSEQELEAARILYSIPTKIRLSDSIQTADIESLEVEGGAGTHTETTHILKLEDIY